MKWWFFIWLIFFPNSYNHCSMYKYPRCEDRHDVSRWRIWKYTGFRFDHGRITGYCPGSEIASIMWERVNGWRGVLRAVCVPCKPILTLGTPYQLYPPQCHRLLISINPNLGQSMWLACVAQGYQPKFTLTQKSVQTNFENGKYIYRSVSLSLLIQHPPWPRR